MTAHTRAGAETGAHLIDALGRAHVARQPYRHWLLESTLPPGTCESIVALPFAPPEIGDTLGKRETHNATRLFFDAANRGRFPVCAEIAEAFQAPETVAAIERECEVALSGTNLRIEYCQDTGGFWLEPHTDIGVKKFTMLVYLADAPGSAEWGTDIYDGAMRHVGRAPFGTNRGLIFVPANDTWHGFARRSIDGIRRSIIINYVGPEWRARHELAFPDRPIG